MSVWLSVRPQAASYTPCPTSTEGRRVPFASEASGFSLEPAPAPLTPEDTAELFTAAWGSVGTFTVLGGAGGSVLAGGRRAWGDASGDGLADGPARGPSALGWQFRAGAAAGEGLWAREPVSGMAPRSPSRCSPRQEPRGLPGQPVPVPTVLREDRCPLRGEGQATGILVWHVSAPDCHLILVSAEV